ncbi:HbrB-like-domain-containing protein [Limtongia smithiae]|uniref:HbrB-like-domain-containing protein n=1 Tax=Limtongia smithiae TaxID=1125753 RepID=UPI0034CDA815
MPAMLSLKHRNPSFSGQSLQQLKNPSTVSLILEDAVTSAATSASTSTASLVEKSEKLKTKANKLLRKTSQSSIATSSAGTSTATLNASVPAPPSSTTSSVSTSARSKFSFLTKSRQKQPVVVPPQQMLTGGPRQSSSLQQQHTYRVLPSDGTMQNIFIDDGGLPTLGPVSSGSSSNSSTTSLSTTPTASSAAGATASTGGTVMSSFFFPKHDNGGKQRRSPIDGSAGKPAYFDKQRRPSIGSPTSPTYHQFPSTTTLGSFSATDKHKHHLLLRSRKDSLPGMILSSSASNSKLTSDAGSIYSFNPSSPANAPYVPYGLQKSISTVDVRTLSFKDINKIGEQALEDVWPFLCARVTPLFTGDGLLVPVEDLNKLVMLHTKRRVAERDPNTLISEVRDMLKLGVSVFDSTASLLAPSTGDEELLGHVVELWQFYRRMVLPYVEAVFVPLQLELDGVGLMKPEDAARFWDKVKVQPARMNNVRRMALAAFRDYIMLALHPRLKAAISAPENASVWTQELCATLLQCFGLILYIQSNDDKQEKIEELASAMKVLGVKAKAMDRAAAARGGMGRRRSG